MKVNLLVKIFIFSSSLQLVYGQKNTIKGFILPTYKQGQTGYGLFLFSLGYERKISNLEKMNLMGIIHFQVC